MDIITYAQIKHHLKATINLYTGMIARLNEQSCTNQDVLDMFEALYKKIPLNVQNYRDQCKQDDALSPDSKFRTLNLDVNVPAHTLRVIQNNNEKKIINSQMFNKLISHEFRFDTRRYNCFKIAHHTILHNDWIQLKENL